MGQSGPQAPSWSRHTPVALSTDWTETGSLTLLDELKLANQLNQDLWGGILTPQ